MINQQENQSLRAKWTKIIDSIDKTEFSTEFIDQIHITFISETNLPKTIDVKKLKALDAYIDLNQIDDIIDAALLEVKDEIEFLDLTVDVDAVMKEAIPATRQYLSKLSS